MSNDTQTPTSTVGPLDVAVEVMRLAVEYPSAVYRPASESEAAGSYTVIDGCAYNAGHVKDGPNEPGCIIGQALRRLDRVVPAEWNTRTFRAVLCDDAVVDVLDIMVLAEDELIKEWLFTVQRKQDIGHNWSTCVNEARSEHPMASLLVAAAYDEREGNK